jgi:hypothetical protein
MPSSQSLKRPFVARRTGKRPVRQLLIETDARLGLCKNLGSITPRVRPPRLRHARPGAMIGMTRAILVNKKQLWLLKIAFHSHERADLFATSVSRSIACLLSVV